MAAPQPSARLVRAVAAERAELERHRARLNAEAQGLRAALARIEHGLVEIDERCGLLERLAPAPPPADNSEEPRPQDGTAAVLRGPAIREEAVKALVEHGRDAIHYREWFDLLVEIGHAVAGKDPLAVFLTQISRSPAVRRGSRAGVYELDRHAPQRLRHKIDALQQQLRDLPATGTVDLAVIRSRRVELTRDISRKERALEEASRLLTPAPGFVAAAG
jgi:hypothetical protein